MQKIIAIMLITLALTACIRKISIEQGNIMTPDMAKQIHLGMSQSDVTSIMGTPVLLNTFNDNRKDYVYTYQPGGGSMTEEYMTLVFKNDRLAEINGNYPPKAVKTEPTKE